MPTRWRPRALIKEDVTMTRIIPLLRGLRRDRRAVTALEYGPIAAVMGAWS
jgi:hypothetical protein